MTISSMGRVDARAILLLPFVWDAAHTAVPVQFDARVSQAGSIRDQRVGDPHVSSVAPVGSERLRVRSQCGPGD